MNHLPSPHLGMTLPHLAAWRQYFFWSQRQLAKKSGVGYTHIARIERGHRVFGTTIERLALAFGITPRDLILTPPETYYKTARKAAGL